MSAQDFAMEEAFRFYACLSDEKREKLAARINRFHVDCMKPNPFKKEQ